MCASDSQFRMMSDTTIETDNSSRNSSSCSPPQDFDWSGRSSLKSEDDEDVLSVGCESPFPHLPSPHETASTTTESFKKKTLPDVQQALKFSIDNILKPEFGEPKTQQKSSRKRSASDDSPVDLSKECGDTKNPKTESRGSSPTSDNGIMWPAWVYCTRYSDRPSSGKLISLDT